MTDSLKISATNPTHKQQAKLSKELKASVFDGADRIGLRNKSKEKFDGFFINLCIVELQGGEMINFHLYKRKTANLFYKQLEYQFSKQGLIKNKKFDKSLRKIMTDWINAMIHEGIISCPFSADPHPNSQYAIVTKEEARAIFKFKMK